MADIFLSYSSDDRDRVIPLVQALQEDGFTVWWDREIRPGPSFDREIETAINEAKCIVVVWSASSIESEWVRSEVEEGARRGILIPAIIDGVMPPLAYRRRQSVDLTHWPSEDSGEYDKLLVGVRATLDGSNPEPQLIPPSAKPPDRRRDVPASLLFAAMLGFVLMTSFAIMLFFRPPNESSPAPRHFDIVFPEDTPLVFVGSATLGNGRRAFDISPNDDGIVYVGLRSGTPRLFYRPFDTHSATELAGTEHAYGPFFSPDGVWVGYFVNNRLMKVRVAGGTPVVVADATNSVGAVWTESDEIIVVTDEGDFLVRVAADGTGRDTLLERAQTLFPSALDSDRILIGSYTGEAKAFDLIGGESSSLGFSSRDIRHADGYLFYTKPGFSELYASRFQPDGGARQLEVPILTDLRVEIYGQGQWSLSQRGTLAYAVGISAASNPMNWVAGDQVLGKLAMPVRERGSFELSPDGNRLAVLERSSPSEDVWVYDLATGQSRKLTLDGLSGSPLVWMPDGKSLIFHRFTGEVTAYRINLALGSTPERITSGASISSVSADGRWYGVSTAEGGIQIRSVEGDTTDVPTVGEVNWGAAIAPDGRSVVYTSAESGVYHVYLQPIPPTGERKQISLTGGAEEPRWSADGSTIYYRNGQRIMMAAVSRETGIEVGTPTPFFEGSFVNISGRSYDIARDGSQALVVKDPLDTTRSLRLVTNWLVEVEQQFTTQTAD
jgi:Tol biopolymer transport system component